ncbi:MAG: M50 family metallopeptidase [Thermodesulfobacteriota bacterium]
MPEPSPHTARQRLWWLVGAAAATVVLWQVPGGNYVLYPFTILATWFHEMAHGLAALMLGGSFTKLMVYSDGSGAACYWGPLALGNLGQALVAGAGPMGPPIAGAILIMSSRSEKATRVSLWLLGGLLLTSTALWVRSLFGAVAIPLMGLAVMAVPLRGSAGIQACAVQFLGVQACVGMFLRLDYLFTPSAGPLGISDTAQIQQVLFLPFWFWGACITALSLAIPVMSLRIAYRGDIP